MTTYLRHGCVPVVVQDGVDMPFERVGAFRGSVDGGGDGDGDGAEALLRWDSFSIRVAEDDMDRLDSILRGVSETEIRRLQDGVAAVWRMFWYDVPEQPAFGPVSLFLFFIFIFYFYLHVGNWTDVRRVSLQPRRPTRVFGGGFRGGGPGDIAAGGDGDGVGRFEGPPGDAFEMIMASLRYKLALREKSRRGTSR